MNNNGFDLLYNLNNKNNTFISLSGTLIKNVPEPKMKTLNSFMKVIPIKMNQGLIEEPRPLSAPKKKKKKNKHIKILAKNKKKKESKKVTSTEKLNMKIKEQSKNDSSRSNKFLNIFMRKTYSSKSESNKYEKKKIKEMSNQKDNSYIDINTSLNNSNSKIKNENIIENNNLKKLTAHNKYKPDLNTIHENETKPKTTKKNKSSTNMKIEEQKTNNIYLKPKILFQEKINHINYQKTQNSENKKINFSQINNQLNKSITQKPNSDIKDILSMNSTHNIDFTTSYRNEIFKPTHQKRLSSISSSDFSEKIKKINKNIINSHDSSKSINSMNNNNSVKIYNNNTNEKKDKILNNSIPFKPFKVKSSEIKNLIQKEDISERIMRIRKSFQEKEIHQSLQNLNLHFYLILPGNASYLVKNCMNHRTNWKEPFSKVTSLYNFKWQELSYGIEYGNLSKYNTHKQIVNHYENHYCISNKANMFCYLMKYCEERKISVFKYVPFTIIYKIKEKRKDKENQIKNFEKENQEYKDNLRKFINMSDKFVVDYDDIGTYYHSDDYIKEIEKRKLIEEENKNSKKKKKKDEKKKEEQKFEEKKEVKKEEENMEIKKEEIKSEEEIKNEKDEKEKEKDIEINKEEKKEGIISEEENNINNNYFNLKDFYSDFFPKLKPNDRIVSSTSETLERERKEKKKDKKRIIGNYTLIELPNSHETGKHMWIVKAINLNRGKCIKVVNSFDQIEKVIDKFKLGVKYDFTEEILEKNENKEKNYQDEIENNKIKICNNEPNIKNYEITNNNIENNGNINYINNSNLIEGSKNNNTNFVHFTNINNINKNVNSINFFNSSNINNINKNYNSINCINILNTNNNTNINTSINNANIIINNNESTNNNNNNNIPNNELTNNNNNTNNINISTIINNNNTNTNNNNIDKNNSENNKKEYNDNNNNNNNENNNKNSQDEKMYLCKKIIIQKYIENPLLYKGRKCDIRIWVLLTHKMKVFVFKEGHLKTCSVDYDVNSKDAFTHITNYSFQKHNNNFQKFEKGNEVPFYEFQKFIDEKYPERHYNLKINLMKKIKKIINLTMRAGKEKINKNNRNYQFELFGYDFMLDTNFNVFLIEINTNPGLEESSPWIKIIIPRMLDDALRLTIDKIFEPKYDFNLNYKNEEDQNNIDNVNNNLKNNIDPNAVTDSNNELNNEEKKNDDKNKNKEDDNKNNENKEKNINDNINKDKNCNITKDNNNENIKDNNNEIKNINNYQSKNKENENKNNESNIGDEENKVIENTNNLDLKDNNNQKYISPFPVPGYSLNENLWEFVCDLNEKDPLDDRLDKDNEKNDNQSFTGIKHLMKKKKNTIKK